MVILDAWQIEGQIKKATGGKDHSEHKADLETWKGELERFTKLLPMDAQLTSVREKELPDLEKQLKDQKDRLPNYASEHANVRLAKYSFIYW